MGDEIPPGELNKVPAVNGVLSLTGWYGAPYYGGGSTRTDEYKAKPIPKELADHYVKPQVEMVAHAADLGMMFYTGKCFRQVPERDLQRPARFLERDQARGARVMVTYLDDKGNAVKTEPFAEGWMNADGVTSAGRLTCNSMSTVRSWYPTIRQVPSTASHIKASSIAEKRAGWA